MWRMYKSIIIKNYQTMVFNMYLAGQVTEQQFDILAAITENMEADSDALELSVKLTQQELDNDDLIDCILAKQFKTAALILE